ncbi:hypothetical protein DFA_04168 [Cavenderia fasciculata]|uniref:mRNA guanylyltransferase n=1 Tax=Cavenderia fasciculata TaxID=261658 RepID=F4Q1H1_CACFS|nr:uncharacterized protein DFA_04168 [Cavenderia fasciculata]EGG18672.1 hypothetical protein DFA_04168 [Cavenderia fasciculata]|eukprot:XP_004366576.1 hypothetical protein DFA_04168 [Cavenderia fasciculata]
MSNLSFLDQQDREDIKRNRNNVSNKLVFSVENICQKIRELYIIASKDTTNINGLEVEARIGLMVQDPKTFRSGIIIEDWAALARRLARKYGEGRETTETDYLYTQHRVTVDVNGQVIKSEAKIDKTAFDQSTSLIYDVRVSTSIERQLGQLPLVPPPESSSQRTKFRHTFIDVDNPQWKIDMTLVRTNTGEETYEVELEIFNTYIIDALEKNTLHNLISKFINETKNIITMIQPGRLSFPDIQMTKLEDPRFVDVLKQKVLGYIPDCNPNRTREFPGAMPINFGKKHFPTIQRDMYYVSEKTDGIRYMILIYKGVMYMIDRKFDFFKIDGNDELCKVLHDDTLLDGEMIRHLESKEPMYFIFDILARENTKFGDKLFQERMQHIGKVVGDYRQSVGSGELGKTPFILIAKSFFEKKHISKIFSSIKTNKNGERIFSDQKRNHQTDGLILTPNNAYKAYADQSLFKWKYLDLWTIDFKVAQNSDRKWFLHCAGPNNTDIPCKELMLSTEDFALLSTDYKRSRDQGCFIAEFSFEFSKGIWKYHLVRPDKKRANYITVFVDTMESICEGITKEELEYRFLCAGGHDNWDVEVEKMRHHIASTLTNKLKQQQQQQHQQQKIQQPQHHSQHHGQHQQHQQHQQQDDIFGGGSSSNHNYDPHGQR